MKTGIKILFTLIILCTIGVQQGKLLGWKPFTSETKGTKGSKLKEISLDDAKRLFVNAHSLTTIDTSWVEVRDKENQKIGELISTSLIQIK